MTVAHWIALCLGLLVVTAVSWLAMMVLWLVGKAATRVALGSWNIGQHLFRWSFFSLLIVGFASFAGIWLADVDPPVRGEVNAETMEAHRISVVKESLLLLFYVFMLMAIHVAWAYLCLAFGLLTGKYPMKHEHLSVVEDD